MFKQKNRFPLQNKFHVLQIDFANQLAMSDPHADYDNPWKVALEDYFQPFLAFFFPAAHAIVDWSRPPESLDKELEQGVRDAELGKRWADKLFKIWLHDGQ